MNALKRVSNFPRDRLIDDSSFPDDPLSFDYGLSKTTGQQWKQRLQKKPKKNKEGIPRQAEISIVCHWENERTRAELAIVRYFHAVANFPFRQRPINCRRCIDGRSEICIGLHDCRVHVSRGRGDRPGGKNVLERVQFSRFFPVAYSVPLCPIQWGGRFVHAA